MGSEYIHLKWKKSEIKLNESINFSDSISTFSISVYVFENLENLEKWM